MATSMLSASAQPTSCSEDPQCPVGFYCVPKLYYCQECLNCDKYKREPPKHIPCITSISDCGKCLKGYVQDVTGDFCVSLDDQGQSESPPWYIWFVITSIIIIFVIFAVVLYIFLRRRKIDQRLDIVGNASRDPMKPPEPPSAPPEPTQPLRSDSNYSESLPPYSEYPVPLYNEETELPLVKRNPADLPYSRGMQRDSNQATKPFSAPYWINNSPLVYENNNGPVPQNDQEEIDENDQLRNREPEEDLPFVPHNEETIPSSWTPNNDVNGNKKISLYEIVREPAAQTARDPGARRPSSGTNVFINVINAVGPNTYQNYYS
ncbi:uncharacterized protein LOC113235288 isoform X2 [Hyposmocoma kahamanoa]|uniref:uncharacterized protein LOC113235288 isoform X2 n=1 Tax=Hyposmocoma kahamanoa TaxID=1477025 RepID=UPI000E6D76BD|nr:uncharacterized protein LOC113235288 isoform X2 [Hyposmocoma kahamanoa]